MHIPVSEQYLLYCIILDSHATEYLKKTAIPLCYNTVLAPMQCWEYDFLIWDYINPFDVVVSSLKSGLNKSPMIHC